MEQVTVTGNENTRIEVVSISEVYQAIKTDEIPKAWSPLWSMDYSMMGKRKAAVVWIYLMNLPAGVYFSSKFEPQHLTGLCGLEFSFVDEPDALCAELGKDSHVRMASVNKDPSSSVTAFSLSADPKLIGSTGIYCYTDCNNDGKKRIIEDLVKYFLRNMPEPDIYEA